MAYFHCPCSFLLLHGSVSAKLELGAPSAMCLWNLGRGRVASTRFLCQVFVWTPQVQDGSWLCSIWTLETGEALSM